MQARGNWSSKFGFIMAAAGSAIGLGNIWKFPYVAGKNGGGGFLLIYLAIVATIGFSVLMAELVIGRATQRNPVGALKMLQRGRWWPLIGYAGIGTAFVILSYYVVVAGWTLAYIGKSLTGLLATKDGAVLGSLFTGFITDPVEPVLYAGLFTTLTILVVIGGVNQGLERASRVLMPALFVLVVVLCIRSLTLPGAAAGWAFFTQPKWGDVTFRTVIEALGQAFFSLSLGMGTMITYGSYISRDADVADSGFSVVALDTLIACMAGLMILPAVFAFGMNPAAGPGLTFVTLPRVFAQMPGGVVFGPLFFILLAIAALTSAVSLLEVVTAYFVDELGMRRRTCTVAAGVIAFALCIPSSLSLGVWSGHTLFGMGFLDIMDFLATNIMLPTGGLAIAAFVGWAVPDRMVAEFTNGNPRLAGLARLWLFFVRYVSPAGIFVVLLNGLPFLAAYLPWN
ncbi:MAG: sodium-dependent transporter [Rhodospirillaceae bacterium]